MNAFEPVAINWKGEQYVIPPDRVLQCIAKIEDVITLGELEEYVHARRVPFAKVAMAFGAVLRHAGAKANDFDVYRAMFSEATDEHGNPLDEDGKFNVAVEAVHKLMVLMVPPDYIARKLAAADTGDAAKKH